MDHCLQAGGWLQRPRALPQAEKLGLEAKGEGVAGVYPGVESSTGDAFQAIVSLPFDPAEVVCLFGTVGCRLCNTQLVETALLGKKGGCLFHSDEYATAFDPLQQLIAFFFGKNLLELAGRSAGQNQHIVFVEINPAIAESEFGDSCLVEHRCPHALDGQSRFAIKEEEHLSAGMCIKRRFYQQRHFGSFQRLVAG